MGFLHKIWDDTLAGPAPESGLGKLRKYNSFSARSAAAAAAAAAAPQPGAVAAPLHDDNLLAPVSRSITVLRSNAHRNLSVSVDSPSSSAPSSPCGSSAPSSPFSPSTPGGNFKKFTRRKSPSAAMHNSEPKSPTGYDWIVLSALDR